MMKEGAELEEAREVGGGRVPEAIRGGGKMRHREENYLLFYFFQD
jgi:hypothetical protein